MTKRRGLGRGLSSLIPGGDIEGSLETGLITLALYRISPNPHQPRSYMDEGELADLAESIREHGLIQPLIVNRSTDDNYTLIAGERRWRAARLAGLDTAPVVVKDVTAQSMLELALIENIQRADLNAVEEALAYKQLMTEFGLTQEEVAERVGKSRPAVANQVRLLNLPPNIQAAVVEGKIRGAHARALLPLPTAEVQSTAMKCIIEQGLSVRQVEALVKAVSLISEPKAQSAVIDNMNKRGLSVPQVEVIIQKTLSGEKPKPRPAEQVSAELIALESEFRQRLGTQVKIQKGVKGGKVVIHFYSDEELQAIYDAIIGDV
jgi:ParB family chromosome partitioning protein